MGGKHALYHDQPKKRSERKAIDVLGQEYFLSPYVGSAPKRGHYVPGNEKNDDGLPQGFLVEQPLMNSITRPHFHNHEQFQLFVEGSAHMGKKVTYFFSLHYVKGHTPYGPITAGGGVKYFTLRARWDTGAKYMPESRRFAQRGSK